MNIRNTYPILILIIGSIHLLLVFFAVNFTVVQQKLASDKKPNRISVKLLQEIKTEVVEEKKVIEENKVAEENKTVIKDVLEEIPPSKPTEPSIAQKSLEVSEPRPIAKKKIATALKREVIKQPSEPKPQPKQEQQAVEKSQASLKLAARKRAIAKYLRLKKSYNQELEEYLGEHRRFPVLAKRFGHQGLVKYKVRVERDGRFSKITKLQSSGYDSLDNESLSLLKQASGFKALPEPLSFLTLNIPIEYKLH